MFSPPIVSLIKQAVYPIPICSPQCAVLAIVMLLTRTRGIAMVLTLTHGIGKDLWYRHGNVVMTTPMVLTETHGTESVLLNHACTRGPSVWIFFTRSFEIS